MIRTMPKRSSAHVLSFVGGLSNDKVTVAAGPALQAGTVLALNAGMYAPYDNASDKLGQASAVLYAPLPQSDQPRPAAVTCRLAELVASELTGLDEAARADLTARFIVLR